jgi:hypothetical protein
MVHGTAASIVRNQKLALGIEVTSTDMVYNRFKIASTTGSHDTYFKHRPNIVFLDERRETKDERIFLQSQNQNKSLERLFRHSSVGP